MDKIENPHLEALLAAPLKTAAESLKSDPMTLEKWKFRTRYLDYIDTTDLIIDFVEKNNKEFINLLLNNWFEILYTTENNLPIDVKTVSLIALALIEKDETREWVRNNLDLIVDSRFQTSYALRSTRDVIIFDLLKAIQSHDPNFVTWLGDNIETKLTEGNNQDIVLMGKITYFLSIHDNPGDWVLSHISKLHFSFNKNLFQNLFSLLRGKLGVNWLIENFDQLKKLSLISLCHDILKNGGINWIQENWQNIVEGIGEPDSPSNYKHKTSNLVGQMINVAKDQNLNWILNNWFTLIKAQKIDADLSRILSLKLLNDNNGDWVIKNWRKFGNQLTIYGKEEVLQMIRKKYPNDRFLNFRLIFGL